MKLISDKPTFTLENIKSINVEILARVIIFFAIYLPFFIFKRTPPNFSFYSEIMGVFLISLYILFSYFKKSTNYSNTKVSLYFSFLALYLLFDTAINPPVYPSLNILYIGTLFLAAFLSRILGSHSKDENNKTVSVVFFGMMFGALLQDFIIFLQLLHEESLYGWINYIEVGTPYSGNISQRNLTAHYLLFGILATYYLTYTSKIQRLTGYLLIITQALLLGFVNSRTLIVYILGISCLLPIIYFWQKKIPKKLYIGIATSLAVVLAFQFISLPLLSFIQGNELNNSSIDRMSEISGMTARLAEWYKAWLIFLEHPLFGSGWGSYGYKSFIHSSDAYFISKAHLESFFSHSHNIIFNILSELGFVGSVVFLFGFVFSILPLFSKSWKPETLILFCLLMVPIVHSMLELPLWHAHFFIVFAIIFSLLYRSIVFNSEEKVLSKNSKIIGICFSIICIIISASLYFNYVQLNSLYYRIIFDKSPQDKIVTAIEMKKIGIHQPLLRSYTDINSIDYLRLIPSDLIPHSFNDSLSRYAYYRPYPTAGIYYLITQCDSKGDWNDRNWGYYHHLSYHYGSSIPNSSIIMSMTNKCPNVYRKVLQQCENYAVTHENTKCTIDEVYR